MNDTVEVMTNFSLSMGSFVNAAALMNIGCTPTIVATSSNSETGHMHLIGKLIVVRLNFPLRIFFPTVFRISLPALLRRLVSSESLRSKPP